MTNLDNIPADTILELDKFYSKTFYNNWTIEQFKLEAVLAGISLDDIIALQHLAATAIIFLKESIAEELFMNRNWAPYHYDAEKVHSKCAGQMKSTRSILKFLVESISTKHPDKAKKSFSSIKKLIENDMKNTVLINNIKENLVKIKAKAASQDKHIQPKIYLMLQDHQKAVDLIDQTTTELLSMLTTQQKDNEHKNDQFHRDCPDMV